ncbi:RNA polymerase sigma-70 factor [Sphingobacterium spiritivorum]|uniref:RNA polymerase sigma-70 factor n=1 Tax=Sphingobacterium spiritivorum TaxID=258 RepID=UPI001918FD73|nr:RNA polymerase sigma-70 factor [Sphingobacterium spiritivorum]QQT27243.1 RNA polymerase sigma-70 factor [Sphingobacterium spiritivorum]
MTNYSAYTDSDLINALMRGEHAAFTEIYKRYWKRLFYIAAKKLHDPEEAEEIVQQIFVSMWNRRENLQINTSLNAYLATSVKYRIIKVMDKLYHQQKYADSITSRNLDDSTQEWLAFLDLKEILNKSISELPEKCQLVFRMSREQYMSQKDIAAALNISEKTVEAHLGKAIKTLRQKLNRFLLLLL